VVSRVWVLRDCLQQWEPKVHLRKNGETSKEARIKERGAEASMEETRSEASRKEELSVDSGRFEIGISRSKPLAMSQDEERLCSRSREDLRFVVNGRRKYVLGLEGGGSYEGSRLTDSHSVHYTISKVDLQKLRILYRAFNFEL
jgi:hypothetical protein